MRLQDGTLTSLRISLPPGFPTDRPALSITSPVRHPWVDGVGRLNFPLLERWGAPNVRLAAVVADAFKGLGGTPAPAPSKPASPARPQQPGQHPPPSAQSSAASLAAAGSGPASMSPAPSAGGAGGGGGAAQPQRTRVVPIPATFAEVAQMNEEQLSRTLADERAYNQLVSQLAASLNLWQVGGEGGGQEDAVLGEGLLLLQSPKTAGCGLLAHQQDAARSTRCCCVQLVLVRQQGPVCSSRLLRTPCARGAGGGQAQGRDAGAGGHQPGQVGGAGGDPQPGDAWLLRVDVCRWVEPRGCCVRQVAHWRCRAGRSLLPASQGQDASCLKCAPAGGVCRPSILPPPPCPASTDGHHPVGRVRPSQGGV